MPSLPYVLLVDDDPTTNFLNQRLLQRLQLASQVQVAVNGQEALALLHARHPADVEAGPALVLLDVNMPVMNGFEFLEAYAAQIPLAQQQATIIIMLSTSLLDADLLRAQQLPIAGFLNKPLTREHLFEVLQRYFSAQLPSR